MLTAYPTADARISRLRDYALTEGQHIGYRDFDRREALRWRVLAALDAEMPLPIRLATAFAEMLAQLEITVDDDDLLAGRFAPAPPEDARVRWEEEHHRLSAQHPMPPLAYSTEVDAGLTTLRQASGGRVWWLGGSGFGHANVNFTAILQRGMTALAEEADTAARAQVTPERGVMSAAMVITLRGAIRYAERHAEVAEALAATAEPARARELRAMAACCRQVPCRPARSFREALQAVWFTYLALGMSESPSANSLGCADRYLYPYYAADLAAGTLTPADAEELLAHFLLKCACYAEGQSLTLGGQDENGADAVNELTRAFFRLISHLGLPEPIISVRLHDEMREDDVDAVVAITAAGHGQPSYYAEARCRAMLVGRGATAEELSRLAINSCMGVIVAGAEVSDMWGAIIGLPLCLEMAVSGGRAPDGTVLPFFAEVAQPEYASIEELFTAYARIAERVIALQVEKYRQECAHKAHWQPNPFLSAVLDDCRTRGLDRLDGGPRRHSVIVEGLGWANVSDALLAIDELVFHYGEITLADLLAAARADYADQTNLLRRLRACPKYGNDHPAADAIAVRVLEHFSAAVRAQRQPGEHTEYLPSLHTLNKNVLGGQQYTVSLDGRRLGAPLNKQVGPSDWAITNGPTAVLASAAKIPTDLLPGGQALDITLPPRLLDTPDGRAHFKALLRTFFTLGGADLQINTVDPATLRAARAHPEQYSHLLVRVAGYSEFFVKLSPETQEDLITRLSAGV